MKKSLYFETWKDPRLAFEPSDYDYIYMIVVNYEQIWHPD